LFAAAPHYRCALLALDSIVLLVAGEGISGYQRLEERVMRDDWAGREWLVGLVFWKAFI
jgi:hypothetical protein